MTKYVTTGTPRKTVGAYLRAVNALNELEGLGETLAIHPYLPVLRGLVGNIVQDNETGEWSFVQTR